MERIITVLLCFSVLLTLGCNSPLHREGSGTVEKDTPSMEKLSEESLKDAPPELKALLESPNVTVESITESTEDSTTTYLNLLAPGDTQEEHGWPPEAEELMDEFHSVLKEDPVEAEQLLYRVAQLRFGDHLHVGAWVLLTKKMAVEGRLNLTEIVNYLEIEQEMLSAVGPEKYAKGIQAVETALVQFQVFIAMMKKDGVDPDKTYASIDFR